MRLGWTLGVRLAAAVSLATVTIGHAAGPGAGKVQSTFIKLPSKAFSKAVGKVTVTPKDFKAGGPPQGSIYKFKFAVEKGDPAKPGLAPGRYIVQLNVPDATSPGAPPSVAAFVTFTIDAANKCTMDPAPSVIPPDGGFPMAGGCGGVGEPVCDGPHVAKCEFTQYQAAGTFFYALITDATPLQFLMRIRSLAPAHDTGGSEDPCTTAALDLTGLDDPTHPCIGGAAPNPTPNPVIAVQGIAAGADTVP